MERGNYSITDGGPATVIRDGSGDLKIARNATTGNNLIRSEGFKRLIKIDEFVKDVKWVGKEESWDW